MSNGEITEYLNYTLVIATTILAIITFFYCLYTKKILNETRTSTLIISEYPYIPNIFIIFNNTRSKLRFLISSDKNLYNLKINLSYENIDMIFEGERIISYNNGIPTFSYQIDITDFINSLISNFSTINEVIIYGSISYFSNSGREYKQLFILYSNDIQDLNLYNYKETYILYPWNKKKLKIQ